MGSVVFFTRLIILILGNQICSTHSCLDERIWKVCVLKSVWLIKYYRIAIFKVYTVPFDSSDILRMNDYLKKKCVNLKILGV